MAHKKLVALVELSTFVIIQMCLFAVQFGIAANEGAANKQKFVLLLAKKAQ